MANENTPAYRLGGPAARSPRGAGKKGRRLVARLGDGAWRGNVVALLLLALPVAIFHPYQTQEGEEARADVKAPYEFSVVDYKATENDKDQIPQKIDHVWVFDDEMNSRAPSSGFSNFSRCCARRTRPPNEKLREFVQKVDDQLGLVLDMTTVNQFQENRLRSLRPPLSLKYVQNFPGRDFVDPAGSRPLGQYQSTSSFPTR